MTDRCLGLKDFSPEHQPDAGESDEEQKDRPDESVRPVGLYVVEQQHENNTVQEVFFIPPEQAFLLFQGALLSY